MKMHNPWNWMREQGLLGKGQRQKLLLWGGVAVLAVIVAIAASDINRLNKDTAEVHKNPTEENKREFDVSLERVKAITSGIGTIATIVGGVFLYLNFRIAEDKQIAERFAKAVEQLGNKEQQQVRLGGIYSLERIAKNSPKDLWTVVEVLSSFIREYAANRQEDSFSPMRSDVIIIPPIDIQAAFAVVGGLYQGTTDERRIDFQRINLSNTHLDNVKVNLSAADLSRADLNHANLSGAILSNANLSNAYLTGAILKGAILSNADLSGATLSNADLSGATLKGAILLNLDFRTTRNLTRQQLEGENRPLVCKVQFPPDIQIDLNRDCDRLPEILKKRYPGRFSTTEAAKKYIEDL